MKGLDLGKQYGPLPLGAWLVVVAGGLGIAWYTKNSGGASDEVVEDGSGVPGVGDGSVGGWVPTSPQTPTTPNPTDPRDSVTDNDKWYTYISRELIGRFNYDPVLVDSALRKYLAGGSTSLSVSEWVIIRAALGIMAPPSPIPAMPDDPSPPVVTPPGAPPGTPNPPGTKPPSIPVIPKPKPKPPAPKPSARWYTVKKGDNLWNISKKYYKTGTKWGVIFNANRKGKKRPDGSKGMIVNSNLIQPGWRLHIP